MQKLDNRSLQEYIIKNIIGRGTFSIVRLGINKKTKEKVAIKILDKSKIVCKRDYMKIIREIKILKNLSHPNVIKIHKICENANYIYIVTEFCENGELFDYILKRGHLSEEESSFFYYQLINGLDYIHKNNISHRDLKLENLLLSSNNTLKIIDFGLSNFFFQNELLITPCGSPCYAPPEMVNGQKYNGFMADVWSSGIILYAMVCGCFPFDDNDDKALFKKIIKCEIHFSKDVGELSKDLIKKIIVRDPEKRITLEKIKTHKFYLKGEEVFYKNHPELIENVSINKIEDDTEAPEDSLKIKNKNYNTETFDETRRINYDIKIKQFPKYNFKTIVIPKNKVKIIKKKANEENQKTKDTEKITDLVNNKINKLESIVLKKTPKDTEKPNDDKIKIKKFISITKISKITQLKNKIRENKNNLYLELEKSNLKKSNKKLENTTNNNEKNLNGTIIPKKYFKCMKIIAEENKIGSFVTINSSNCLKDKSNSINKTINNMVKQANNSNMNDNKNKKENSDLEIIDNSKKLNSINTKNPSKKLFYNVTSVYPKTSRTNNNHKLQTTEGKNNIKKISRNNLNFSDPSLDVYIEKISVEQNNTFQSPIYYNNSLKENDRPSNENKNPIVQETMNLQMGNTHNDMNLNYNKTKFSTSYNTPSNKNNGVDLNSGFRKTNNFCGNNFINYKQEDFNISKDYDYNTGNFYNTINKISKKSTNQQPFIYYNNIHKTEPKFGPNFNYIGKYDNYNLSIKQLNDEIDNENNLYNNYLFLGK